MIELPKSKDIFVLIPLSGPSEEETKDGITNGDSSNLSSVITPVMNINPGEELKLPDLLAMDIN